MLNSARRLQKKAQRSPQEVQDTDRLKRYAVALRSGKIACAAGHESRRAVAAGGRRGSCRQPDQLSRCGSANWHRVIRGLLAQSLQPRKIVLYLSLDEFPDRALPQAAHGAEKRSLRDPLRGRQSAPLQEAALCACRFSPGNDPHRRRRQSLSVRLPGPLVGEASVANPRTVICVRGRCMQIRDGEISPLHGLAVTRSSKPSFMIFPVGGGASFILPRSLDPMIDRQDMVREIAPPERRCLVQGDEPIAGRALSCDRQHASRRRGSPTKDDLKIWDVNQQGQGYQQMVVRCSTMSA